MAEFPDDDLPPTGWDGLPDRARGALESAWDSGVPGMASAVHARWWQLETWLRSLAYVERRTAYGAEWLDIIGKNTVNRAETEMKFSHMTSTDANLVLSHLDVSALFEMIKKDWHLFERALIDQEIWEGRVRELKQVRHRIAHCRRPHRDDLLRIEQMLRDLERGAFRAIASFNTPRDPGCQGWVRPAVHKCSPLGPVTVMAFTVADGAVTTIHALTAPTRLGQLVPSWVA